MRAQEVEGGEELSVDAPGHVVDDQHVRIEALGDRLDEILAQAAHTFEADAKVTGLVRLGADLLHRGQLDEIDAGRRLERVGGLEAGHDEDRRLGKMAAQVGGNREAPAEVPEAEGVVRVEEQSDGGHFTSAPPGCGDGADVVPADGREIAPAAETSTQGTRLR